MTSPRKPRAKAGGNEQASLSRPIGAIVKATQARAKKPGTKSSGEWKPRPPAAPDGGSWLFVPAGKVAFLRDVAAHRKNAREAMARKRVRDAQEKAELLQIKRDYTKWKAEHGETT